MISYQYRFLFVPTEFVNIYVDIDYIVSISSRICTQLQHSIFNLDIFDIDDIVLISIYIWTELNLSIFNVDIDATISKSIFLCLQLKLYIFFVCNCNSPYFNVDVVDIDNIVTILIDICTQQKLYQYQFAFVQNSIKYFGKLYLAYLLIWGYSRSQFYHFTIL